MNKSLQILKSVTTLVLTFFLSTLSYAQSMVKDLWPGSTDGFPYYITSTENTLFFRCENATVGRELWTSNGFSSGTALLKDIYSGSSNSSPTGIFEFNNKVLFSADNGINGVELWISDGTANGTYMLKDLYSGGNWSDSHPYSFAKIGNKVVFVAEISSFQHEPMVTDGTTNGTTLLKDIYPGSAGSLDDLYTNFTECNGNLYFAAVNQTNGTELWKTNGTTNGTVLVKDINPGSNYGLDYQKRMVCYDNEIYFQGRDGSGTGYELWKSDGTANGTVLVKDINPGSGTSNPTDFAVANGILYFVATDGSNGRELWRTDGTNNGTYMVKDIYPGSGNSGANYLTEYKGKIYFSATNPFSSGQELFVSDGTAVGTKLFHDFYYLSDSYPSLYFKYGGLLYVSANIPNVYGREVWVIDGDSANTKILKDIWPGTGSSYASGFMPFQEKLYFFAQSPGYGAELWVYNPCQGTGVTNNIISQGDSLISVNSGVDYQWYYCGDAGDLEMTGANDSIFSPILSGKYKVEVSGKGCVRSSGCTYVNKSIPIYFLATDTLATDVIVDATYQWFDCDAQQLISGETNLTYAPANAGKYAVIVKLNGIVDTSDCLDYAIPGFGELTNNQFSAKVFPNPNNGEFTIEFKDFDDEMRMVLQDINGKMILDEMVTQKQKIIDLRNKEDGLYLLKIQSKYGTQIEKIIKF